MISIDLSEKESILNEMKILSKISSDCVVRYCNCWPLDSNLYIQMEYCSDNLNNILKIKPSVFGRIENQESMQSLEYYITCRLFIEILQCIQYLHELNPPVIHRDLKPATILFDERGINGHFIKLCDFGLTKLQDKTTMETILFGGTSRFRAPEILRGVYDWRSDIYSLSVIATELFEINSTR